MMFVSVVLQVLYITLEELIIQFAHPCVKMDNLNRLWLINANIAIHNAKDAIQGALMTVQGVQE